MTGVPTFTRVWWATRVVDVTGCCGHMGRIFPVVLCIQRVSCGIGGRKLCSADFFAESVHLVFIVFVMGLRFVNMRGVKNG